MDKLTEHAIRMLEIADSTTDEAIADMARAIYYMILRVQAMEHGVNYAIDHITLYEPSVDIVRCKDCKWSKANGTYQWCGRLDSTARITADDFCSYGERREP